MSAARTTMRALDRKQSSDAFGNSTGECLFGWAKSRTLRFSDKAKKTGTHHVVVTVCAAKKI
jgi:hypothetical protein